VLRQVADGVLIHQSEFCQSNAVVVQGPADVLLVDPGVLGHELATLADDLRELGQPAGAGFATHPHWDHMLWDASFGTPPRYVTARGAEFVRERLSDPGAKARVAQHLIPPDIADQVPLDLMGQVTGLPAGAARIPWAGPSVQIIEHQAHAPGHAALLIGDRRVLLAGDMLSDVLVPMLDLMGAADPIGDYLSALRLLEDVVGHVDVLVPGHGSVATAGQIKARIDLDRAYVEALRDGGVPSDPRIGPGATYDWVAGVHERQRQQLAQPSGSERTV
jgi:glyoxylase-like metal-dependent hydrolase (beta-lactamase superfamily II)